MSNLTNALALKSKTINLNALFLAIVSVASALGYNPEPELVAAIQTIFNILLRFLTTTPLGEKA